MTVLVWWRAVICCSQRLVNVGRYSLGVELLSLFQPPFREYHFSLNVQFCEICPENNNSDEVKGVYIVLY